VQSSSQIVTNNIPTPSFLQAGYPSCLPTNSVKVIQGVKLLKTKKLIFTHTHTYEEMMLFKDLKLMFKYQDDI